MFRLKKWISHCILKMLYDHGRVTFLTKKISEKAKLPKICISFGGSMPIAQIEISHLSPFNAAEMYSVQSFVVCKVKK